MRGRVSLALSITAVVIAVFGSTPVGEAARDLVAQRPTIGTPQLKNGAVTTPKLKNNAVTSLKVLNGSLLPVDFKPGSLPSGATGPAGPAGPTGPAGPAGPTGAPGLSGVQVVTADATVNPSTFGGVPATCPAGKVPIGGGVNTANLNFNITTSRPEGNGWGGRAYNSGGAALSMTTYAVCATVAP